MNNNGVQAEKVALNSRGWAWCAAGVMAATVFVRIVLGVVAWDDDLVGWVPDDAFYYLTVARHVVAGHGLTFDGTNPASGFHPLWLLWCVLAGGRVRTAVAGGIVLACGSAYLLWRLLRSLRFSMAAAALGVVLYAVNQRFLVNSVNGMETALTTFLWLLLVLVLLRWHERPRPGALLPAGIAGGLLWLARTDMAFTLLAATLFAVRQLPRPERWRGLGWLLLGLAPLPLGWLLFHYAYFGTLFAASADAMPFVVRNTDPLALQGLLGHAQCGVMKILQVAGRWGYITGWPLALPLTLALLAGLAWRLRRRDDDACRCWQLLAWLWSAAGMLLLVHAVVRLHPAHWYFETVAVLMLLTFLLLGRELLPRLRATHAPALAVCGVLLCAAVLWPARFPPSDYPWQKQLYRAAEWAQEETPPDAVIGAFDAGILAYYAERRVVNLDGVINDHAGRAVRERRLFAYMREQGITYYIDHDPFMRDLFTPFFGDPGGLRYDQLATFADGTSLNNSPVSAFRLAWPAAELH